MVKCSWTQGWPWSRADLTVELSQGASRPTARVTADPEVNEGEWLASPGSAVFPGVRQMHNQIISE